MRHRPHHPVADGRDHRSPQPHPSLPSSPSRQARDSMVGVGKRSASLDGSLRALRRRHLDVTSRADLRRPPGAAAAVSIHSALGTADRGVLVRDGRVGQGRGGGSWSARWNVRDQLSGPSAVLTEIRTSSGRSSPLIGEVGPGAGAPVGPRSEHSRCGLRRSRAATGCIYRRDSSFVGTTTEMIVEKTEMRNAASTAHQKPSTRRPQSAWSVIQPVSSTMSALTTSVNSPSVKM